MSAVETLGRKKNLRVLEGRAGTLPAADARALDVKRVRGGFLVQDRQPLPVVGDAWRVVTRRAPSAEVVFGRPGSGEESSVYTMPW